MYWERDTGNPNFDLTYLNICIFLVAWELLSPGGREKGAPNDFVAGKNYASHRARRYMGDIVSADRQVRPRQYIF
jgi:hypothetical protein